MHWLTQPGACQVQESLRRINAQRKVAKSPDDLAFQRSMAIIYGLTAAVLCAGLLQGVRCWRLDTAWLLQLTCLADTGCVRLVLHSTR